MYYKIEKEKKRKREKRKKKKCIVYSVVMMAKEYSLLPSSLKLDYLFDLTKYFFLCG